MIKDFLKHSFIYGFGTLLTRGISFILLPIYTRTLSTNDYGVVSYLSNLFIFLPFVSWEIIQAIGVYYCEQTSEQAKKDYFSTVSFFLLATNGIFCIIVLIFSKQISFLLLGEKYVASVLLIAVISTAASNLFSLVQAHLLWRLKSLAHASISFFVSLSMMLLSILFILKFRLGVMGVFLSSTLANLLGIGAVFAIAFENFSAAFHFGKLKEILKFSIPLIPSNIGYYGLLYMDQILIKQTLGLKQAGIYSVASRLVIVMSLLISAFASGLSPLIYQRYHNLSTKVSIEKIARLFLFFVFVLISAYILLGQDIIQLLTTHEYESAARLLPLLGLGYCFSNLSIFSPGLLIAKKTKLIAFCHLAGCLLNVVASLLLISRFGIVGAALATAMSALFSFILYFRFSQPLYRIEYQWVRMLKSTFIFLIFNGVFYHLDLFVSTNLLITVSLKGFELLVIASVVFQSIFNATEKQQFYGLSHQFYRSLKFRSLFGA